MTGSRAGMFSISQVLGAVVVIFLGLAIFGSQNALMGMMNDAGNKIIDMLGTISSDDGLMEEAVVSTEALSYAISCTGILNARSPEASGPELQPLRDAWKGPATPQINRPCSEAANDDGVTFESNEGNHTVDVVCDSFEAGPGGSCEVYNFTLPQADMNAEEDYYGMSSWILGRGTPQHIVYYQSLPETAPIAWQNLGDSYNALAIAVSGAASLVFNGASVVSAAARGGVGQGARIGAEELTQRLSDGATNYAYQSIRALGKTVDPSAWRRLAVISSGAMKQGLDSLTANGGRALARTRALMRDIGEAVLPPTSAREAGELATQMTRLSEDITRIAGEAGDTLSSVPSGASKQQYREALDDVVTKEAFSPTLRPHVDDELLAEAKEQIARKWVAKEEAIDAATDRFTGRVGTLVEGGQMRNALRSKYFKQIVTADEIGNQILNKYAAEGAEGGAEVARRMVGKGIETARGLVRSSSLAAREGSELAFQNAKRVACAAPGITSAAMLDSLSRTRPTASGGADSDPSSGNGFLEDLGSGAEEGALSAQALKCAAYSGTAQQAMRSMCSDVGVPVGDIKAQGQYGIGGTGTCVAMTALGTGIQKAAASHEPHRTGSINSLYLYNPEVGRMEFELNKWANFFFVAQNKDQAGYTGDINSRFFLASPFQTDNLEGSDAKLEIEHNEIRHVQSGWKRAQGPEDDWCNLVEGAVQNKIDKYEARAVLVSQIFESIAGFGGMQFSRDRLVTTREKALEQGYQGSFGVPAGILCEADIVFTKDPILGRKVDGGMKAPPGASEFTLAGQGMLEGDEVDTRNLWSSYLPTANPRGPDRTVNDFEQVGGWYEDPARFWENNPQYNSENWKTFEVRGSSNVGVIPDKYISADGTGTTYHKTDDNSPWLGEEFTYDVDSLTVSVKPEESGGQIIWQTEDGGPVYGYDASSTSRTVRKWSTYIAGGLLEAALDSCVATGVGASATGVGAVIGAPSAALCGFASAGVGATTEYVAQELENDCYWPVHGC